MWDYHDRSSKPCNKEMMHQSCTMDNLIAESVKNVLCREIQPFFLRFKVYNWKLMPVDLPLSMCWFSLCASYCSLLTYLSSGNLFVIFLWHCRQMYSSPKSDRYSVWEGELTLFSPRMCIYFQCTRSSLTNSIGCVFHACLFLCSYLQ